MSMELYFLPSGGRDWGAGRIIVPGSLSPDDGRPGVNFSDLPPTRNSPSLLTAEQKALFTNPNRPRSKEEVEKIVEDLKKTRDYLERIEREGLDKDLRSANGQLKLKSKEEVAQEVEKIKQGIEKTMSSSPTSSLPLVKKYKELYHQEGKLSQEDVNYLIENNLMRGVIPPHELSIANNPDDGLDSYRDVVYGHHTSLNAREIMRANNYHSHAFLSARWAMMSRMKKGEDLRNFTSIEHFAAVEALSRANIHYANRFLNKESPTSNDLIIGQSLLGDARSVSNFALGMATGITCSIIDTMNGIPALVGMGYNAIRDYNNTIDQFHRLIEQFDGDKFFAVIGDFFANKGDQFADGDASVRGEMIGALFAEITTMFIPGTGLVKAATGAAKYSIPLVKTIGQTRLGEFVIAAQKLGARTKEEIQGVGNFLRNTLGNEIGAAGNIDALLAQAGRANLLAYSQATRELIENGIHLSGDAGHFLAKQARYANFILEKGKSFSRDDLVRIANSYESLFRKMDHVTPVKIDAEVWRAVPETVRDSAGKIIATNTENTVFRLHQGTNWSNSRYSAPGDSALYTSMGTKESAWQTVMEELGEQVDQNLLLQSKHYQLDKVLDLTDPNTRKMLGITEGMITRFNKADNIYELTHQLGNVAKNKGYQAIKAPSATPTGGVNLIIFGE